MEDIIIEMINTQNFKKTINMCINQNINFEEWYNQIKHAAPEIFVNLEDDDGNTFIHIEIEKAKFWIKQNNQNIELSGIFNFYKYYNQIFKFKTANDLILEVKPIREINNKSKYNWYISEEEDYFAIEYDINGRLIDLRTKHIQYYHEGKLINKSFYNKKIFNKKLKKILKKKLKRKYEKYNSIF